VDCRDAQETILDSLIDRRALTAAIDAHIAACPVCAAFAARQKAVDAGLQQTLMAPDVSARLREAMREQIRQRSRRVWHDALPDLVHFASCGAMTLVSVVILPFSPMVVIAVGLGATLLSHAVLTAMHGSLDAAGDGGA
jgi:anti-sigma factor RsiW